MKCGQPVRTIATAESRDHFYWARCWARVTPEHALAKLCTLLPPMY